MPNEMKNFYTLSYLFIILLFSVLQGFAQGQPVGIDEKLNDTIPKDMVFVDENYDTVNIYSLIDKPTVITPVYYECPGLCSPLLEGVADAISSATIKLGKDYQVFTISFNPKENTKLAKAKKENYARLVKSTGDVEHGWIFFTGDSANINKLLDAIGYNVKRVGTEWVHPAAIVVLSPGGKITRYLRGVYFLPFELKMAVVEASEGRASPTINKVLQFCFSYDPAGRKYVFNTMKVSGVIILTLAASFFLSLVIRKKPSKSTTSEK
jgi:protein SCO1/2